MGIISGITVITPKREKYCKMGPCEYSVHWISSVLSV